MLLCSAPCCGVFSVVGFIFLISIGVMLEVQPIYVKGAKHPADQAVACYEGAAIYAATFILSVGYIYYKKGSGSSRRGETAGLIATEQSNYGKYFVVLLDSLPLL